MARLGMLQAAFLLLPACAGQSMIPLDIEKQIDPTLSFTQVKEAPATHLGKVIVLGGEILDATRLKEHTRLTVLQLPTSRNHEPAMDRTKSQGRFLAFQTEFLDPATVPNGTRITIVGKISGATTELLDEMDYTYPTVTIQFLKVWPRSHATSSQVRALRLSLFLWVSLLVCRTLLGPVRILQAVRICLLVRFTHSGDGMCLESKG